MNTLLTLVILIGGIALSSIGQAETPAEAEKRFIDAAQRALKEARNPAHDDELRRQYARNFSIFGLAACGMAERTKDATNPTMMDFCTDLNATLSKAPESVQSDLKLHALQLEMSVDSSK
jgi:hypothetical protein